MASLGPKALFFLILTVIIRSGLQDTQSANSTSIADNGVVTNQTGIIHPNYKSEGKVFQETVLVAIGGGVFLIVTYHACKLVRYCVSEGIMRVPFAGSPGRIFSIPLQEFPPNYQQAVPNSSPWSPDNGVYQNQPNVEVISHQNDTQNNGPPSYNEVVVE